MERESRPTGRRGRLTRRRPSGPDPGNAGAGRCERHAERDRELRRRRRRRGRARPGVPLAGPPAAPPGGEAGCGEQGLLALSLAAAEGWPSFAAELEEASGLGVPYERCGSLLAAFDADEAVQLRRLPDFPA